MFDPDFCWTQWLQNRYFKILKFLIRSSNLITILTLGFFGLSACDLLEIEEAGYLVPPTADQDHLLPSQIIEVAGHKRTLHLRTFGDPNNPPVFVLHGGPGGDFRLLLPLQELADEYFIIMWDSRGAGLSERVTKEELSLDSLDDELDQLIALFSPRHKARLIGHSFGANVMVRYTAKHPEKVAQLILIEAGKLDQALSPASNGGAVSFSDGQDFFWQNEILTSTDHAAADYKAIDLLPKSARNWTCDRSVVSNYPFWRFGAYHYFVLMDHMNRLPDDYNWAEGIENFTGPMNILAGTCGALGAEFQHKTNIITLKRATLHPIQDAGHLSLFTEHANKTVSTLLELLE